MCLYTVDNFEIAKEDIECYKVLKRKSSDDFRSPYYDDNTWNEKFSHTYKAKSLHMCWPHYEQKGWFISSGYFHTFTNLNDALEELKLFRTRNNVYLSHHLSLGTTFEEYCIAKCIIPEGSIVYSGYIGGELWPHYRLIEEGKHGYASGKLRIEEITDY